MYTHQDIEDFPMHIFHALLHILYVKTIGNIVRIAIGPKFRQI